MDTHPLDAPTQQDAIFADADVAQFTADDTEAGRAICQMLSIMFAYTVGVMVLSTLVTIYWTSL